MFDIEEIIKLTEEMGINISDGADGKHYILDEFGKKVEFSPDMLVKVDEKHTSYKMKMEAPIGYDNYNFKNSYRIESPEKSYKSKTVNINESIIGAA